MVDAGKPPNVVLCVAVAPMWDGAACAAPSPAPLLSTRCGSGAEAVAGGGRPVACRSTFPPPSLRRRSPPRCRLTATASAPLLKEWRRFPSPPSATRDLSLPSPPRRPPSHNHTRSFSVDDNLLESTWQAVVEQLLAGTLNPNGCRPPVTWFVAPLPRGSVRADCASVQRALRAGHELAVHTLTHPGDGAAYGYAEWAAEISGGREWLVDCGVPRRCAGGQRARGGELGAASAAAACASPTSCRPSADPAVAHWGPPAASSRPLPPAAKRWASGPLTSASASPWARCSRIRASSTTAASPAAPTRCSAPTACAAPPPPTAAPRRSAPAATGARCSRCGAAAGGGQAVPGLGPGGTRVVWSCARRCRPSPPPRPLLHHPQGAARLPAAGLGAHCRPAARPDAGDQPDAAAAAAGGLSAQAQQRRAGHAGRA